MRKLNRIPCTGLYGRLYGAVSDRLENVLHKDEKTCEEGCTPCTQYTEDNEQYRKPVIFELNPEQGKRERQKNEGIWRLAIPVAVGAAVYFAAPMTPEGTLMTVAGAVAASGLASLPEGIAVNMRLARITRMILAGAVAAVTVAGSFNAIYGAYTGIAAALIAAVTVYRNPVLWNEQIEAQGENVNAVVNQIYYKGENDALKAWTSGGHERVALAARQGLRGEDGRETAVHERLIATIGRVGYLQGHEDASTDRLNALKKVVNENAAELKRRDDLVKSSLKLAGKVVSLEKIPEDDTEELAEYVKELVRVVAAAEADEGSRTAAADLWRTSAHDNELAAKLWQARYNKLYERTAPILDALNPLPDEDELDEIPDNVLKFEAPEEQLIPEATPEAVWKAHYLEGLSWQKCADRFHLKARSSAQTIAGRYNPDEEPCEEGAAL